MANDIWSKKQLTEAVQMMAEAYEKLSDMQIRTTRLVSMIFNTLPDEEKQRIIIELTRIDENADEKTEEEKEGDKDGEGDAV